METETICDAALRAWDAGLCVLPVKGDGSKAPDLDTWAAFRIERPMRETTEHWFHRESTTGLGLVCGHASGGLEMFEFEGEAVATGVFDEFCEAADLAGLGDLVEAIRLGYEEQTPSGGIHWLWFVDEPKGNTKLARKQVPDADGKRVQVLIETRGEGGYTVVAPSGGATHPTGKAWQLVRGGFEHITKLSADERDALFDLARSFDLMPAPEPIVDGPTYLKGQTTNRPGDGWNEAPEAQRNVCDLLSANGYTLVYTRGDVAFFRRPGSDKTHGISLSVGYSAPGYLCNWSTGDATFDAGDPGKTYSPFAVYALLVHGGDWAAAAKQLAANGYGEPLPAALMERLDRLGDPEKLDHLTESQFDCVDLDNARRLVAGHGEDLHFVRQLGAWFVWDGHRWAEDLCGEVERRAKQTAESILYEASICADQAKSERLQKWWVKSRSAERLSAMIRLAQSEPGISLTVDQLDADIWCLNTLSGTIDLRDGSLRDGGREGLCTKLAPVVYDPQATCDGWLAFLDQVFDGDTELISWLQRAVGYSLTGDTSEQVLFFLHGSGANGKSTFTRTIQALLGDYALQAAPDLLIEVRGAHPTGVAELFGRRFVVSQEVDDGKRFAESLVKQLTGGDVISARRMRQDFFSFTPVSKLWLAANHKPEVRGTDYAIWRRIKLVPFTVTFPPEAQDRGLAERLQAELSGILNWALEGLAAWREGGLGACQAVEIATTEYRNESDTFAQFVSECCEVGHAGMRADTKTLLSVLNEWCEANGDRRKSVKWLTKKLGESGFKSELDPYTRRKVWLGIQKIEGIFSADQGFEGIEGKVGISSENDFEKKPHIKRKMPSMPSMPSITQSGENDDWAREVF